MDTLETKTIEKNGHTYTVKILFDTDPDTSCMGEYVSKADTWCVWRKDGTLRGDYPSEPEYTEPPDGLTDEQIREYEDRFDDLYADWQDADPVILADDLHTMGRNEYAFFVPFCGGYTGADVQAGKVSLEEWSKYALQDYERMEGLNRGHWYYVGIVVETKAPACPTCAHRITLDASLWGIESDDEDYRQEVIQELISDLEYELDCQEKADFK